MILKLPDSWADVKLGSFQELEQANDIIEKIAILANEDSELIKLMDVDSFNKFIGCLEWINLMPEEKNHKEVISIDNKNYSLIKLSSITLGSWIDIEHYLKEPFVNLHKLMAIFYRPDGEENYNSSAAELRADLFKEKMNTEDAYSMLVFFSRIEKRSMLNIKVYLQIEIMKQSLKKSQNLKEKRESQKKEGQKNGAGCYSPITWLKGMLRK